MASLIIIAISCVLVAFTSLLVFLQNTKGGRERSFLLFSITLINWLVMLALLVQTEHNVWFGRIIFANTVVVAYELFEFLRYIAHYRHENLAVINKVIAIVGVGLALSPFVLESLSYTSTNEVLDVVAGRGVFYVPYLVGVVWIALSSVWVLNSGRKKSDEQERRQIRIVTRAFLLFIAMTIFTNALIPAVLGNSNLTWALSLNSAVLVGLLAYAIVKHGFLNVRLIVARFVAYLLVIFVLVSLYILIILLASATFLTVQVNTGFIVLFSLVSVFGALSFQPLKVIFDRWTKRVFYRDGYDTAAVLDKFNTILVSTLELDELLERTSELLARDLKVEFAICAVRATRRTERRVVGTKKIEFDEADVKAMRAITPKLKSKIVYAELPAPGQEKARTLLRKYNIALLSRIVGKAKKGQEGTGYMLLGAKKSGAMYTSQDMEFISLIVDELEIAIQNSLRYEEIKQFSKTLQHKVDEATKELKQKNAKLRELDQAKDDFISMASHQLRTPLTSIKGYLSMIEEGDFGKIPKQQQNVIDMAYQSAERMVYLIADLLNVSRLSTGKFVIEPVATKLPEVIKQEVRQLDRTFRAKDQTVKVHIAKGFPIVMLDETKTRQVIMNFIDNASYYTPAGGEINIYLDLHKDSFEFKVVDNGIGVPKSEQEKLFKKFFRATNAKKARPDGNGLGLYMAQQVVSGQGGKIIFESEEGKGSTFGFRFALAAVGARKAK